MALEIIDQRESQISSSTEDMAGEVYRAYVGAMGGKKASQMSGEDKTKAATAAYRSVVTSVGDFLGVGRANWAGNATLTEYASQIAGDPRQYAAATQTPLGIGELVGSITQSFQGNIGPKIVFGLEDRVAELRQELIGRYGAAGKAIDPDKVGDLGSIVGAYGALKRAEAATSRYA